MKISFIAWIIPVVAATAIYGCTTTVRSKEVLLQREGKERHWVIREKGLIVEEHCLAAHGDLHVVIEYPQGVRASQVNAEHRDPDVKSVVTTHWPSGKVMSRGGFVGTKPNGDDFVWWPNGKLVREAHFTLGKPAGVWKFYNQAGTRVGEGVYVQGKRQSGVFIGKESAGGDFFFTIYPMKKFVYVEGSVQKEEVFLEELKAQ